MSPRCKQTEKKTEMVSVQSKNIKSASDKQRHSVLKKTL